MYVWYFVAIDTAIASSPGRGVPDRIEVAAGVGGSVGVEVAEGAVVAVATSVGVAG
jgi:hypothetical protein